VLNMNGETLLQLIKDDGLTQKAFAELVFVSSRYINQIIKENKTVPNKILKTYELQKENQKLRETVSNLTDLIKK